MKKSLIAAAGATLAVSAMPVVGVFADAVTPVSFTDQVQVTVKQSCVFEKVENNTATILTNGATREFSRTDVAPGTTLEFNAGSGLDASVPTIKFFCTQDGSKTGTAAYEIKAVGSQTGTATAMTGAAGNIATDASITSGETSAWAMKVNGTNVSSYQAYNVIPSDQTTVQSGNASTGADVTFTPMYRVYVGTNQAAGTYTGKVTYTLSATITNQN